MRQLIAGLVRGRPKIIKLGASFALDVLPAVTIAFSMRRLLTSYVANKAINVRRNSDNATLDVGFLANGDLDVPSLTTFLAATTGAVTTWYDQSGSGLDVTNGTAAQQPAITLAYAPLKSLPVVSFDASASQRLTRAATPSWTQPNTRNAVAQRTANFTTVQSVWSENSAGNTLHYQSSADTVALFAGANLNATASDALPHAITAVANGASSSVIVDVTTVNGAGGAGTGTGFWIGARPTVDFMTGPIAEVIGFMFALSAPNIATLHANQKAYWGTP